MKAERGEHHGWVQHHPAGNPGLPAPLALSLRLECPESARETEAGRRAVSKLGKVTEKLAGGSLGAEASEQPVLWLTLPSCLY